MCKNKDAKIASCLKYFAKGASLTSGDDGGVRIVVLVEVVGHHGRPDVNLVVLAAPPFFRTKVRGCLPQTPLLELNTGHARIVLY